MCLAVAAYSVAADRSCRSRCPGLLPGAGVLLRKEGVIPDVGGRFSVASKTEWKSEGRDAPCGRPDPRVSLLSLWREEVVVGGHVHRLGGHLREVDEPRLIGLVGGNDRGSGSRFAQLERQVVE